MEKVELLQLLLTNRNNLVWLLENLRTQVFFRFSKECSENPKIQIRVKVLTVEEFLNKLKLQVLKAPLLSLKSNEASTVGVLKKLLRNSVQN